MTARHQVRLGVRLGEQAPWSIESQPAPTVGELLVIAREKKGVTLERAERDTKIRARHLAALENGDPTALPAAVYAKGFLRNYASYLGLDPDELLMRWRAERDALRAAEKVAVLPPPRPIAAPRRGFLLTPGVVVAAVLAIVVVAFVTYVGLQLVRFAQNPEVVLDGPSVVALGPDARVLQLAGSSTPGTVVSVSGADTLLLTSTADDKGRWRVELPVAKGQNDFAVVARDPITGRETAPLPVIASVPVDPSPSPRATPRDATSPVATVRPPGRGLAGGGTAAPVVESAVLALAQPAEATVLKQGKLTVGGATDAEEVVVSFEPLGGGPERAADVPQPLALPVVDGGFAARLQLAPGRWRISVETVEPDGRLPAVLAREIRAKYEGVLVLVEVRDGYARIRASIDGKDQAMERLGPGESRTYSAKRELVIRSGNRQATWISHNGRTFVQMGSGPKAQAWRFAGDEVPVPVP
jgi:transcriptional regulator with XRE-family HTH domain